MCGVLAAIKTTGMGPEESKALSEALELIHHRGPDETDTVHVSDQVIFGFKRLSIIDVATSHQPMSYLNGRYTIVFNGEIYNYRELREELINEHGASFTTAGDTEVILAGYHAWGNAVLSKLRGMFAFIIYDQQTRRLFVARDHFGIKPLYWTTNGETTFLASEKKALTPFTIPNSVDTDALAHYATFQYPPEPHSLHPDIKRLPAGYYAEFPVGAAMEPKRYFQPMFTPQPAGEPQKLYDRITETLRESVHLHMRSDVPVGAFLSSGIDSTAMVALAREVNPNILTFTAAYDLPDVADELDIAQDSARQLGVTNIPAPVSTDDVIEALPQIVWHLDDPVADPSLVPLWFVAKKASEHVTVALGGEGADELFGGYGIYREPLSLKPVSSMPKPVKSVLKRASGALPDGVKGKNFLVRGTAELEERFVGNAKIFTGDAKEQLLEVPGPGYQEVTDPIWRETEHLDPTTRMQYLDMHTWMRGDILTKADRMSMAHSLEVRVPFLDRKVYELAATLPLEHKVQLKVTETKLALRKAMRNVVPAPIVNRPKLGFPTPTRMWLAGPLYEWADTMLSEAQCGHLININYARDLLRQHKSGEADHGRKLWTVLIFCLWYKLHVVDSSEVTARIPLPRRPLEHSSSWH